MKALNILSDMRYYKILKEDPTQSFVRDYHHMIKEAYERNILNKTEKRFLSNPAPTMALFYHLPKVHKNCEKPPGRPIISGIGSLTCHLSHYIDLFLQDLVKSLPSYLRDSTQLIEELRDIEWEDNYSFILLDVNSLYSNIDHEMGVNAVGFYLAKTEMLPEQRDFLLKGLKFILEHNVFIFEGVLYLQLLGTAMGTRVAPSFANLFMGRFESSSSLSKPVFYDKIRLYKRFIDDLIIIWKGTEEEAAQFIKELNNNTWGITFTSQINKEKMVFLDLEISHSGRIEKKSGPVLHTRFNVAQNLRQGEFKRNLAQYYTLGRLIFLFSVPQ
ncbi:unnamed protein product, partial [Ranitomeya imitator]